MDWRRTSLAAALAVSVAGLAWSERPKPRRSRLRSVWAAGIRRTTPSCAPIFGLEELKRIQADLGATVLYVTHDQIEAITMATFIGAMCEGTLVQIGTPREIYESPNDLYVATRLGSAADQSASGGAGAAEARTPARATTLSGCGPSTTIR